MSFHSLRNAEYKSNTLNFDAPLIVPLDPQYGSGDAYIGKWMDQGKRIRNGILAEEKRSACGSACELSKLFTMPAVVNELLEEY